MLSWSIKRYKSCFSFSYHLICSFLEALKSDWLFCFSKAVSLAGKMLFRATKWFDLRVNQIIKGQSGYKDYHLFRNG